MPAKHQEGRDLTTPQQATALSYFDLFWMFSMAAWCVAPLVFLMRRSVAEKKDDVVAH